jgi:hypothetical protein
MLMVDGGGSTHVRRRGNTASAPASTLTSHLPRPAQSTYSSAPSYGSANMAERRMIESSQATAKPKPKPGSDNSRHPVRHQGSQRKPADFASANLAEYRMSTRERHDGADRRAQSASRSFVDPELMSARSYARVSRPFQPKPVFDPEARRAQLHLNISKPSKPKPKPSVDPELMSARSYLSVSRTSIPKPVPGTAGDLPAARRAYQRDQKIFRQYKNSQKLYPSFAGADHYSEAKRNARNSRARLERAEASKGVLEAVQNTPLNSRERLDAWQRYNLADQRYDLARQDSYLAQGLDRFGKPIKIEMPKPKPERVEESSSWLSRAKDKASSVWDKTTDTVSDGASWALDHKSDIGHTALDMIGIFEPTPFADGINAVWYLAEGDKVNGAISAAGILPYVGDLAKVVKYGYKSYKVSEASESSIKVGQHRSDASLSTWNPFPTKGGQRRSDVGRQHRSDASGSTWNLFQRDLWNPFGDPAPNAPRNAGSRVTRLRNENLRRILHEVARDDQLDLYGEVMQESDSN